MPDARDPLQSRALRFVPDRRIVEPEVMDQPGLDAGLHRQALEVLGRVNWLSRTAESVWRPLSRLAAESGVELLRVLDVACGGGDVTLRLAKLAAAQGVSLSIAGCDISPLAVEYAREQAQRRGLEHVQFFTHDGVHAPLPDDFDAVICTLFLHHLSNEDSLAFLRNLATAARRMVVLNDLRRTRLGFLMARLGSLVLTRSPVVRIDGPQSVAAAFSIEEVRKLSERAGLTGATIERIWPQRFLLTWRKP